MTTMPRHNRGWVIPIVRQSMLELLAQFVYVYECDFLFMLLISFTGESSLHELRQRDKWSFMYLCSVLS